MDRRREYLETVRDLAHCSASAVDYDIIRSSGLIRKLLLDGRDSLADLVNRDHREKIVFDVIDPNYVVALPPLWESTMHLKLAAGFDWPNSPARIYVARDAFFKMNVGHLRGARLTVHDLVMYTAHVLGGVHSGKAKSESQLSLEALDASFEGFDRPLTLTFFRNLGPIVIDALRPLTAHLQ